LLLALRGGAGDHSFSSTFPSSTPLHFTDLINENAERYVGEQNNSEKRRIQTAIIRAIDQYGGKFLKPSSGNRRTWQQVPFEETRQKVAHALQYRIRACRGEVVPEGEEGAVAPSTSPSSNKEPAASRKRVAAAAASSGERSNRKKTTTTRTVAARPAGANNAIGTIVSMEEPQPINHAVRSVSLYEQASSEYHHRGGYDQAQGYLQQQQPGGFFGARAYYASSTSSSFEDYHPYHHLLPELPEEDPSNDFLPIQAVMPETCPFDAFNAGFTVIPIFDGSSDSDESSEVFRWSDQPDE
jgi:hypothetical protein